MAKQKTAGLKELFQASRFLFISLCLGRAWWSNPFGVGENCTFKIGVNGGFGWVRDRKKLVQ